MSSSLLFGDFLWRRDASPSVFLAVAHSDHFPIILKALRETSADIIFEEPIYLILLNISFGELD